MVILLKYVKIISNYYYYHFVTFSAQEKQDANKAQDFEPGSITVIKVFEIPYQLTLI